MHIDMQPQMDNRPDHEGAMARADLYKLANYSLKLFKMMESNTQLEGWVQAKITKSADYIATVYHYLEYEMKFSEYGQAIDDSDVYTESQKRQLKSKLLEAKEKIKDLKKVQAEKAKKKEKKEELDEARATDKKKGAVTKSEKAQYFAKTTSKDGKTTKGSTHEAEEGETEGDVRDRVERDAKSKGETVDSFRKKELDEGKKKNKKVEEEPNEGNAFGKAVADAKKDGIQKGEKIKVGGKEYSVKEATDKKCNHTAKGKNCPVHGLKECGSMYEAAKQTMSRAAKGHEKYGKEGMAALAKAGKEGKSLEPVRAKYNKYDEGTMPMKKVDGKSVPAFAADGKGKNDLTKKAGADKKDTAPKKGVNPFAKK